MDDIRTTKMKKYTKKKYVFAPRNVPLRSFWIDDRAISQPDRDKVQDCIYQEEMTRESHARVGAPDVLQYDPLLHVCYTLILKCLKRI